MHEPANPGHKQDMSTQTSTQSVTSPVTGEPIERPENFIKPGQIYLAHDRYVCEVVMCSGMTALCTGYTIGGARLIKVTGRDVKEWAAYGDLGALTCECGALEATLDDKGRLKVIPVVKDEEPQA